AEQMHDSLSKLLALFGQTRVYCAHEYTLSNLRWALAVEPTNPELARWNTEAQALRAAGRSTIPTLLSHERQVNPFLRTAEPSVVASVSKHHGRPMSEEADVFGALRAWKDNFR